MTKEQKPYYMLANAIIVHACKDYMAMKEKEDLIEIKQFFRGDWFATLTDVDPEWLIKFLNKKRRRKISKRLCLDHGE